MIIYELCRDEYRYSSSEGYYNTLDKAIDAARRLCIDEHASMFWHKLNENVWVTPGEGRYEVGNDGRGRGLHVYVLPITVTEAHDKEPLVYEYWIFHIELNKDYWR